MSESKDTLPKTVLVAIGDPKIQKSIVEFLTGERKIADVKTAADGEAAWALLKETQFECVIFDWAIEKVSGLILFNRLKQDERYQNTPLFVVSKLAQKESFLILKDYPLSGLAAGDFSVTAFSVKFDLLIQEMNWYRANAKALDTISAKFKADASKARDELSALLKSSPNPLPTLNMAAAKFCQLELYREAELLLDDARKLDERNSTTVMELARVYHLTGRRKEALELMKNHKFSVKNIGRLLLVGEINLAEKDPDEARKLFSSALDIDPDNQSAKDGVVVADNFKQFLAKSSAETLGQSFASTLNLVAVSLVKSDQQEEAIQQYKAALAFVHDALSKARLMYNLGLGYLRWSKKAEALEWFKKSLAVGGVQFNKAEEQIKLLMQAPADPAPAKTSEKAADPKAKAPKKSA